MGRRNTRRRGRSSRGRGAVPSRDTPSPSSSEVPPAHAASSGAGPGPGPSPDFTNASSSSSSTYQAVKGRTDVCMAWDALSKQDKLDVLDVNAFELFQTIVLLSPMPLSVLEHGSAAEAIDRLQLEDLLADAATITMLRCMFVESVKKHEAVEFPEPLRTSWLDEGAPASVLALLHVWEMHLISAYSRQSANAQLLLFVCWFSLTCPHLPGMLVLVCVIAVCVALALSTSISWPGATYMSDISHRVCINVFPDAASLAHRPESADHLARCTIAGLGLVSTCFWSTMYTPFAVIATLPLLLSLVERLISADEESAGLSFIIESLLFVVRIAVLYFSSTWTQLALASMLFFPTFSQLFVSVVGIGIGFILQSTRWFRGFNVFQSHLGGKTDWFLSFSCLVYICWSSSWMYFMLSVLVLCIVLPDMLRGILTSSATVYAPLLSNLIHPLAAARLLKYGSIFVSVLVMAAIRFGFGALRRFITRRLSSSTADPA